MLFSDEYSMKMPIGETLLTALIGIITVLVILSVIALLIMLVSKVIQAVEKKAGGKTETAQPVPSAPAPANVQKADSVDLIGVDEPTAAVVMAIVSDKSGIPLNRLKFKSIKLVEEKK